MRTAKYILVGLVAMQLVVMGLMFWVGRGKGGGGADEASVFPIWLVIFIPIIAMRRKKVSDEKKEKVLWLLTGLAAAVLLIMVVFLLKVV